MGHARSSFWFGILGCAIAHAHLACEAGSGDDASTAGAAGAAGSSAGTGGTAGSAGTVGNGGSAGGGGVSGADAGLDGSAGSGGSAGSAGSVGSGGSGGGQLVTEVLVSQSGDVFTPNAQVPVMTVPFGTKGTTVQSVRVEFDVTIGDYQPEIPDEGNPDRTEHILFGLFRANQTKSDQRYLMGSAAVTFATKAPHFRMFGRVSIGPGYTTYTQWSTTYSWQKGQQYHLDCLLDAVTKMQTCELSLAGSVVKSLSGAVSYLDAASHLSSGFFVDLGVQKSGDIETSALGWTYANLKISATKLP